MAMLVCRIDSSGGCSDGLLDDPVDLISKSEIPRIGCDIRVCLVHLGLVHTYELLAEIVCGSGGVENKIRFAPGDNGVLGGVSERYESWFILHLQPWVPNNQVSDVRKTQINAATDLGGNRARAANVEFGERVVLRLELMIGPGKGEYMRVEVLELDLVISKRAAEIANNVLESQEGEAIIGEGFLLGKEVTKTAVFCNTC